MNEAETRAELIDPKLKSCGWGIVEGSKILRERDVCKITDGRIQVGGKRKKPLIADYILVYKGIKLAVVEAKSENLEVGEGVAQAKQYAEKLNVGYTYSTNGKEIYQICMETGEEGLVSDFFSPQELWEKTYPTPKKSELEKSKSSLDLNWLETFLNVPFEDKSGTWKLRFYQEIAVRKTLEAVAKGQERILLTLATGTGKTAIAFQISWKLFQTRWNLNRDGKRQPRILFLADRNVLADQAFNSFSSFPEDAMIRIRPNEIKKRGKVPTNGSIFFTIFQTFMSGKDESGNPKYYFGDYPKDFFDFIIIDECHRGGANDEGNWRQILDYFSPAVQLGLTATPKRSENVDTYKYFGDAVYTYSLKEGINDGFLTPFKVKRIKTTLDEYVYTNDDDVLEGEVEEGKIYEEADFNRKIEIKEREKNRVEILLNQVNQKEKAIIFCANQAHAALIRDFVNQLKSSKAANYCVRVTANDKEIGEQFLREFQDNEKTLPTILTTSQKLSTGVDARNIRNIVLLRPIKTMIEFKQIIGRGTRLFEGKDYFTIYDFVGAYHHFVDPEWDGEPIESEPCEDCGETICICEKAEPKLCEVCEKRPCICPKKPCKKCGLTPCICIRKVKIKLRDGKERQIQHITSTSFWSADGRPISAEDFLNNLFGELPNLFKDEEELRTLWSNPITRKTLLEKLEEAGFGITELETLKSLIEAEKSDLFDVLEYVFNSEIKPITREERVIRAKAMIFALLDDKQKEFIDFVLSKYVEIGVEELDQDKLPILLKNKYNSIEDAKEKLGEISNIRSLFLEFQRHLYDRKVA
ncbi:MAG: restriction endonuclease subunit R [Calditrichaeota bacterium]|nr:MAG: restriction endonuclease subunit R [Calditrichota bacterium]